MMHEKSIEKIAFYANGTLYEWFFLPFGLKCAPASFVMLMNIVLKGYVMKFCFV